MLLSSAIDAAVEKIVKVVNSLPGAYSLMFLSSDAYRQHFLSVCARAMRNLVISDARKRYAAKRAALKAMAKDPSLSPEERFNARLKLAQLPRNSSPLMAST